MERRSKTSRELLRLSRCPLLYVTRIDRWDNSSPRRRHGSTSRHRVGAWHRRSQWQWCGGDVCRRPAAQVPCRPARRYKLPRL